MITISFINEVSLGVKHFSTCPVNSVFALLNTTVCNAISLGIEATYSTAASMCAEVMTFGVSKR